MTDVEKCIEILEGLEIEECREFPEAKEKMRELLKGNEYMALDREMQAQIIQRHFDCEYQKALGIVDELREACWAAVHSTGQLVAMEETATLRDQFARAALIGLGDNLDTDRDPEYCYRMADAMLEARKK